MTDVRHRSRRQPGRDRGPGHPHAARAGHPLGRRLQRRGRRTPGTSGRPTRPSGSARRRPPRAICRSSGCWRPPRRTGAQAVHPGYGFLAENAAFARACAEAGLVFIGPPPRPSRLMGDKIRAKETVRGGRGPGRARLRGSGLTDDDLADAAREIGFPVLLKPSAGGGGKGMRLVARRRRCWPRRSPSARREARAAFGDDTLLVERCVDRPRHIEIQVLADGHGNVVHLGERECCLQRRHQKIIEEAPVAAARRGDPRARWARRRSQAARSVRLRRRGHGRVHRPGRRPGRRTTSWR